MAVAAPTDAAVAWLLESPEPAVRYLTRRDVLGEDVAPDPHELLRGPWVLNALRVLAAAQRL